MTLDVAEHEAAPMLRELFEDKAAVRKLLCYLYRLHCDGSTDMVGTVLRAELRKRGIRHQQVAEPGEEVAHG